MQKLHLKFNVSKLHHLIRYHNSFDQSLLIVCCDVIVGCSFLLKLIGPSLSGYTHPRQRTLDTFAKWSMMTTRIPLRQGPTFGCWSSKWPNSIKYWTALLLYGIAIHIRLRSQLFYSFICFRAIIWYVFTCFPFHCPWSLSQGTQEWSPLENGWLGASSGLLAQWEGPWCFHPGIWWWPLIHIGYRIYIIKFCHQIHEELVFTKTASVTLSREPHKVMTNQKVMFQKRLTAFEIQYIVQQWWNINPAYLSMLLVHPVWFHVCHGPNSNSFYSCHVEQSGFKWKSTRCV